MRNFLARAALRSVLVPSAVVAVALLGPAGARQSDRQQPDLPQFRSQRAGALLAAASTSTGGISGAGTVSRTVPAPDSAPGSAPPSALGVDQSSPSDYVLRPEGGPQVEPAARLVTATLLSTGLVLTALGAVGTREKPGAPPSPGAQDRPTASGPGRTGPVASWWSRRPRLSRRPHRSAGRTR